MSIEDVDDLLGAVVSRLAATVAEASPPLPAARMNNAARHIQQEVRECVAALNQLHKSLRHESGRRDLLEQENMDARRALAQAQVDLAGTKAGERHARYLAQHDGLTALPNRGHFRDQLHQALSHAEPHRRKLALIYLDLDGFKAVNDAHGHAAGDQLLKIVAARLKRAIRSEDTVSRLGGDEFVCMVAGMTSHEHLGQLARKLFFAVAAPIKIGELKLSIRPSLGIALCPHDGSTVDSLLENADAAMYRAKRRQSGHAFFNQGAGE